MADLIQQITAGPHQALKSPDGSVELLVRQSALPGGVSAQDIKISPLPVADSGVTMDGAPPMAAYRLEPDLLRFATPAVVRVTTQYRQDAPLPNLYLLSKDGLALLTPATSAVDVESGKATVAAPLTHFSRVVSFPSSAHVTMSSPGDQEIGRPFQVEAVVSVSLKEVRVEYPPYYPITGMPGYDPSTGLLRKESQVATLESWQLTGSWHGRDSLRPPYKDLAPPWTSVTGATFPSRQTFTCRAEERGIRIAYTGVVKYKMQLVSTEKAKAERDEGSLSGEYNFSATGFPFDCRPAGTLPTPTPTPLSVSSDFEAGLDGWKTSRGGCQAMQHRGGGGNPGGFLYVDNDDKTACRLLLPDKFRGPGQDLSAYYGGRFSFDGKMFDATDEVWDGRRGTGGEGFNYGTLTISGDAGVIQIDLVKVPKEPAPQYEPWTTWQRHTARIVAGPQNLAAGSVSWTDPSAKNPVTEAQIRAVLKRVTSVDLNVEAIFGAEAQGIDNVVLTAGSP